MEKYVRSSRQHFRAIEGLKTPAKSAVIAAHATHKEVEAAILGPQRAGTHMRKLSIVGKDYQSFPESVRRNPK